MKMRDFQILGVPTGWKSNVPERVNPEKQVAIAGTEVTCPKCRDVIGRLSVPIFSGMRIPADAIEFASRQKRHKDQKAECKKCGAPYMIHRPVGRSFKTFIHATIGWVG